MENVAHSTGTFIGISKVPIFYQRWLPQDGIERGILVIVHGLGEHSGRYRNVVERLLPEGYGIYALDHQGFGRSGGRRGHVNHFRDYLADVRKLVAMARSEQPTWPLALFGHSMGGLISLAFALDYPQTIDYLVVSAPALAAETPRFLVWLMRLISRLYPVFSLRRPGADEGTGISRDPEEVKRFLTDPLFVPVSSARWVVEFLAAQSRVVDRAEELTLPLLMMQGTGDTVVIPAATEAFFERVSSADKTLLLYTDYYHELHNDIGKEKPLNDLAAWLNQHLVATTEESVGAQ